MDGTAEGIGRLARHPDGTLEFLGTAIPTPSPSYLRIRGTTLYAVNEGAPAVSAFRLDGDSLVPLGAQPAAGSYPCSLAVVDDLLIAACYGDGAVGVHRIAADGSLGPVVQTLHDRGSGPRQAQEGPHAHDALRVADDTLLTTDLGTDRVHLHGLSPNGLDRRGALSLPAGSGPRDLRQPLPGVVWVLGELSAEVFVLRAEKEGFAMVGSVPLHGAADGDHAAALEISADGRFAYAALRGSNRISVLAVSVDGTSLRPVGSVDCGGDWPRHLVLDGDLLHVANQLSHSITTFRVGSDGIPVFQAAIDAPSPSYLLPG